MLNLLTPYLSYIKIGAIVLVVAVMSYIVWDYSTLRDRIAEVKAQKELILGENKRLNIKLDELQDLSDEQKTKLNLADIERIKFLKKFNIDINILLSQKPPKECAQAIDWAIKNKGDLSWPK